jgi:tubulin polyglutamylase TTLL5
MSSKYSKTNSRSSRSRSSSVDRNSKRYSSSNRNRNSMSNSRRSTGSNRGKNSTINPELLKPVRKTLLHGEKVKPRYGNLKSHSKEDNKIDDDEEEEEEEFINTSIDYKKPMDEDEEQYEDDSFEDEGNSPLNIHKQRRQQQTAGNAGGNNSNNNNNNNNTDESKYTNNLETGSETPTLPKPTINTAMSIIAMENRKLDQIIMANPEQRSIHEEHARLGLPKNLTYAVHLSRKRLPVIIFKYVSPEKYRLFSLKAHKRSELVAMQLGPEAGMEFQQQYSSPDGKNGGSSPKRHNIRSHVPNCSCEKCRRARRRPSKHPTRLVFRTLGSEISLIIATMQSHGFLNGRKWNVLWTSQHLKSYFYQGIERHQRVNQYPRSYEITRKDTLCRNINRMKAIHGDRNYGFIPNGWVLPTESDIFERFFHQNGGCYIVKPAALSCGRGIYVTDDINDIALHGLDENVQVSQYIANPLLLDGYKFDLRMYVGITSFDPLTIFVHDSGLARFATEKYSSSPDSYNNKFMHLTNFSINKMSEKFRVNTDADNECEGQKWSLAALRKRLCEDPSIGPERVKHAFDAVNDIFIKTFIAIEAQVNSAMKMFVPFKENCFQLFGFDIMFDETLRPWLIEINFAPSLACGSPLDLKLKSRVVSDLLTLSGVMPYDPMKMSNVVGKNNREKKDNKKKKVGSKMRKNNNSNSKHGSESSISSRLEGYTTEEKRAILSIEAQDKRSNGYTRIFPSEHSHKYRSFFQEPRHLNDVVGDYFSQGKRSPHQKRTRMQEKEDREKAFGYHY